MNSEYSHTSIVFPTLVDTPINWKTSILFTVVISMLIWFAMYSGLRLYVLIGILGIIGMVILMKNSVLWICVVFAGYIPIFWKETSTFTTIEAVHAIIFYGGLLWWFFERIIIKREPIRWSAGSISFSLVILLAILMIPVSLSFDADPFILIREICVMGSMLIFIPMAHELKTKANQKFVFILFIIMLVGFALKNVALYKQKILSVVQFWQVGASRESELFYLLFVLSVIAIALMIGSGKPWQRLIWLGIFVVSIVASILTFYRTVWLGIALCAIVMGVFLGPVYWKRMIKYGVLSLFVCYLGFVVFFSNVISLPAITTSISERFLSSKNFTRDISVRNRTVESEHSLQQSGVNLIIGHGLGTQIHFINFIEFKPVHTTWSHNAYPWLLYHFGIVGSFVILFSIFWFAWKGLKLQQRLKFIRSIDVSSAYQIRALLMAGVAILLITMVMGWSINPFLDRPMYLAYAVVCAFIEIWDKEFPEPVPSSSLQSQ